MILNFGKHRDQTTEWVWENDRNYAEWILRTESENPYFNMARAAFAQMRQREQHRDSRQRAYEQTCNESAQARANHFGFDGDEQFFRRGQRQYFNEDFFNRFEEFARNQQRYHGYGNPPPRQQATHVAWWDELGVNASDPVAVIKTAYRKLAMKYHPDRNHEPEAAEKMKRVNVAYQEAMKGR